MTRKVSGVSSKKLTRQTPIIAPIKEGEELREILSEMSRERRGTSVNIERKSFNINQSNNIPQIVQYR